MLAANSKVTYALEKTKIWPVSTQMSFYILVEKNGVKVPEQSGPHQTNLLLGLHSTSIIK